VRSPLLRPRWLAAHLVALSLLLLFVNLGQWQLRRLDERRLDNLIASSRFTEAALDLESAFEETRDMPEALVDRRVIATGKFDPDNEALIRSQVENGRAGFWVITPFVLESGASVLVNRGWVPLDMGTVPVLASPSTGSVRIEAIVAADQARPDAPLGEPPIYNRVDVDALGGGEALPIYLVLIGERSDRLPIPLPLPDYSDEGNHLIYAVQWFAFALIGVIGYGLLLRRARQARDNFGVGKSVEDGGVDADFGGAGSRSDDDPRRIHDGGVDPHLKSLR